MPVLRHRLEGEVASPMKRLAHLSSAVVLVLTLVACDDDRKDPPVEPQPTSVSSSASLPGSALSTPVEASSEQSPSLTELPATAVPAPEPVAPTTASPQVSQCLSGDRPGQALMTDGTYGYSDTCYQEGIT